jgi:hypothetical protein
MGKRIWRSGRWRMDRIRRAWWELMVVRDAGVWSNWADDGTEMATGRPCGGVLYWHGDMAVYHTGIGRRLLYNKRDWDGVSNILHARIYSTQNIMIL